MDILLQVLGWLTLGLVLSLFFFYVEEKESVQYQIDNDERLEAIKGNPNSVHLFIIVSSILLSVFGVFSPILVYIISKKHR